jgi:hypothetical protein
MFIGIICSNQRYLAILGQYKIYVNICANADSRKSILKFLSKTEKNGTNANFDSDFVDDFFLISLNCFFVTVQSIGRFFIPSLKNNVPSNIWRFSVFWYVLTQLVSTSDLLYWTVVLFLFFVLAFVCF